MDTQCNIKMKSKVAEGHTQCRDTQTVLTPQAVKTCDDVRKPEVSVRPLLSTNICSSPLLQQKEDCNIDEGANERNDYMDRDTAKRMAISLGLSDKQLQDLKHTKPDFQITDILEKVADGPDKEDLQLYNVSILRDENNNIIETPVWIGKGVVDDESGEVKTTVPHISSEVKQTDHPQSDVQLKGTVRDFVEKQITACQSEYVDGGTARVDITAGEVLKLKAATTACFAQVEAGKETDDIPTGCAGKVSVDSASVDAELLKCDIAIAGAHKIDVNDAGKKITDNVTSVNFEKGRVDKLTDDPAKLEDRRSNDVQKPMMVFAPADAVEGTVIMATGPAEKATSIDVKKQLVEISLVDGEKKTIDIAKTEDKESLNIDITKYDVEIKNSDGAAEKMKQNLIEAVDDRKEITDMTADSAEKEMDTATGGDAKKSVTVTDYGTKTDIAVEGVGMEGTEKKIDAVTEPILPVHEAENAGETPEHSAISLETVVRPVDQTQERRPERRSFLRRLGRRMRAAGRRVRKIFVCCFRPNVQE